MEKFFEGTKFRLITTYDGKEEDQEYMLCETHEPSKVFQIICVSGYNAGKLVGYINIDEEMQRKNYKAITLDHLKNEVKRNFIYKPGSLSIHKSNT